jgi:hypothetical protein
MSKTWLKAKRMLVLVALGGSTFTLFGGVFGAANGGGCYYPTFANYTTLLQSSGDAVIKIVSDTYFKPIGTDYDAVIRVPTTAFAQSVWNNWVAAHVPTDLPNNTIVAR